jgi:hypothetical protein
MVDSGLMFGGPAVAPEVLVALEPSIPILVDQGSDTSS